MTNRNRKGLLLLHRGESELLRRSYAGTNTVEIENQAVLVFEDGKVRVFPFAA